MAERKEIKFIMGDRELTVSPELIERVYRDWMAHHPGCTPRDMTSEEFSQRMMKVMLANAVKLQTGTA
jgi:hypothetical protein